MIDRYEQYGIKKIGYLDIEATSLKANFGFMLSWVMIVRDVKTGKTKTYKDVIKRADILEAYNKRSVGKDKRIVSSLIQTINDTGVDLLIGHYFHGWGKMDIPFVRTRTLINKISGFPKYRTIRFGDTWRMAHQLYSINSYRLDAIGYAMGIKTEKTPVDSTNWQLAADGDAKALRYVQDHNLKDVIMDMEEHIKMEKWVPIPASYV